MPLRPEDPPQVVHRLRGQVALAKSHVERFLLFRLVVVVCGTWWCLLVVHWPVRSDCSSFLHRPPVVRLPASSGCHKTCKERMHMTMNHCFVIWKALYLLTIIIHCCSPEHHLQQRYARMGIFPRASTISSEGGETLPKPTPTTFETEVLVVGAVYGFNTPQIRTTKRCEGCELGGEGQSALSSESSLMRFG